MASVRAMDRSAGGGAFRGFVARTMRAPLLEAEDEQDLIRRWQEGGEQAALDALIASHGRLVVSCARRYRAFGVAVEDLVQEGNLGLLEAARRFDPAFGVRFSGYAAFWVRYAIEQYIRRNVSVVRPGRAPRHRAGKDHAYARGRVLPDESLNEVTPGLDTERQSLIEDSGPGPEECMAQTETGQRRSALLAIALQALNDRERAIVVGRWLSDRRVRLARLGDELGVTAERVRQIELMALRKIRRAIDGEVPVPRDLFDPV
jgi:RNA polymerase sigma-32 factor